MAARLRDQGHAVSLRHYEPRAVTCPSCGRASLTARETGICRPCQLRRKLAAVSAETSEIMARMPAEVRETYERTEAGLEARVTDPMPRRPRRRGKATRYQLDRDEEDWQAALERWETRRLEREVRRAQKRKERMRRKLWNFLHTS